ncbi:IMP dehydrogenase [Williamsoniiplasma lucivorax]|uniref:Inosine 5'-monophosphate dehydrogenase n=1 Tax=Williamsoniiplasma lucivorax TaxID=209274 RepID=A0A2S5RD15_9MOLU|nr:IMP dehydrogenase [Williamsoniiplasma lucivorax]PPE05223.1 inosine 5'-monophosphate dehydrogenase [Williamsoniiplasma lucivorax]
MKNLKIQNIEQALTFDDILAVPAYSEVLPKDVCLKTKLTNKIKLNIPLMSSAMDTVTESAMSIQLALLGGVGVIHKNLSIAQQAQEVKTVKTFKVEKEQYPCANFDEQQQLIVGAAISTSEDALMRLQALIEVGLDFVVIDSAHGHSLAVINLVKKARSLYPDLQIIAGNIATYQAAKDLHEAGVDAVKVGIGPGSICTTRVVAGIGVPQITAVANVYAYCQAYDLPLISDGGIKYSGDLIKALGVGADVVMLGSMFAGTKEAPGNVITINDQHFKSYVGMGSMIAMERGSSDRYFQKDIKKLVPEGIESLVKYKGEVANIIYQLVGGLRSGMGYTGCKTISEIKDKVEFVRITYAGLSESHPHGVEMVKEPPNYK